MYRVAAVARCATRGWRLGRPLELNIRAVLLRRMTAMHSQGRLSSPHCCPSGLLAATAAVVPLACRVAPSSGFVPSTDSTPLSFIFILDSSSTFLPNPQAARLLPFPASVQAWAPPPGSEPRFPRTVTGSSAAWQLGRGGQERSSCDPRRRPSCCLHCEGASLTTGKAPTRSSPVARRSGHQRRRYEDGERQERPGWISTTLAQLDRSPFSVKPRSLDGAIGVSRQGPAEKPADCTIVSP